MNSTRPPVRQYGHAPLLAGLLLLGACASNPPPPSQPATVVPVVETPPSPPPPAGDTTSQAAATEGSATAPEPECQAAEDCKKLREPAAGLQWSCENARCLEQPIADTPKTEQAAAADTEKTSKKAKGKGKKK